MTTQVVNPWNACAQDEFNYDELEKEFGLQPVDEAFMKRFTEVTGHEPHPLMKRGIFFAHRIRS
jgi:tryptophanyl-tRNA synthetase